MSALPFVDEHSRRIAAPPSAVWDAARRVMDRSFDESNALTRAFARSFLHTEPDRPAGPRPLEPGSEMTGFRVVEAVEGERLVLDGRHRFSRYRLEFVVEPAGNDSCLCARTYAEFPGVRGRIYRAFVIDSRAHLIMVRRMLGAAARRAERS
jgi:hypothetical protein